MKSTFFIVFSLLISGCTLFSTLDEEENDFKDPPLDMNASDMAVDASTDMPRDTDSADADIDASDMPDEERVPYVSLLETGRSTKGLIALWEFDVPGNVALDKSGQSPPMNLIPQGAIGGVDGRNGITIGNGGHLDATDTSRLYSQVTASGQFTLEIWIQPANKTQAGPARILTFSEGMDTRNFTLGQEASDIVLRLRTSDKDIDGGRTNGTPPVQGRMPDGPAHYVVTYDHNVVEIWANGQYLGSQSLAGGLGSWDSTFGFRVADESGGERQWTGELYMASIYNRALSDREIQHHYELGSGVQPTLDPGIDRTLETCTAWPFDLFEADQFEHFAALGCTEVDGDVLVESDANLRLLEGVTSIGGDLRIIGTNAPNLGPLNELAQVRGDLLISGNSLIRSTTDLSLLGEVGGDLTITDNLTLIDLKGLEKVAALRGHLSVNRNPRLASLTGLGVQTVSKSLTVDTNRDLTAVGDLRVTSVGEGIVLARLPLVTGLKIATLTSLNSHFVVREMSGITTLDGLGRVNSLRIIDNPGLTSLTGVDIGPNTSLRLRGNRRLIDAELLVTEMGTLYLDSNTVRNLDFPNLTKINGGLVIDSEDEIVSLTGVFPVLGEVGGEFKIRSSNGFDSFNNGFKELKIVGGAFQLDSLSIIRITNSFSSLTRVDSLRIQYNGSLPECDAKVFRDRFSVVGSVSINNNFDDGSNCP